MNNYREYDSETLKRLHNVEIEILDEFVRICDKHKLTYYLSGGTLLGAIRHKGFIPWDDDIDVSMFRSDYDKFIEIASKELDSKYFLDCYEVNKDYYLPFAKIKKNNTIFDEEESTNHDHHKGIFIDIFPLDNVKNNHKLGKIRALFVRSIVEVILYKLKIRPLDKVKHPILVFILSLFGKKTLIKWQRYLLTKNKDNESKYVCALSGSYAYEKEVVLRKNFYPPKKVMFEGKEYNGMNNNDAYLSQVYGDYMKLPPKEKRVNHMPLEINFDTKGNGSSGRLKKVLFLQIKGKSYAGVWNVNKLVGEELIKNGYSVHIVSIRDNQNDVVLKHDPKLIVRTINEKDIWETYHIQDIVNEIKKLHLFKVFKMVGSRIIHDIKLIKDIKKLHKYIFDYEPDYIITSHYQLLDMVPKNYLSKTIHEQHTSLKAALADRGNKKTFLKYKNKIKFLWLSEKTREEAIKLGYTNSTYIYNAVRIRSKDRADVLKNKRLVTIARLSNDKRIDVMIDIVEEVFNNSKYKDWCFEIYGDGPVKELLEERINNKKQIKLLGVTDDPKKVLLSSSINLNTSPSEGFSLSILEACECGIPTIAFNFGESTKEQIIDGETGIIVKDIDEYKKKLMFLMDNKKELDKMSKNVREFAHDFRIENIISKWIELLK